MAAAVAVTAGALVSRGYPFAGFYISMAGLGGMFLLSVRKAIAGVLHYRGLAPLKRAWVALQAIELLLLVNFAITGRIMYFPVLLVLAAEYFIYDSGKRE